MINIFDKVIEFFKPKKEKFLKNFLDDCLRDKNSSFAITSLKPIGGDNIIVTVHCDKKYWKPAKFIEDIDFILDNYFLKEGIDKGWSMNDVRIQSVMYLKFIDKISFTIFCKKAEIIIK